MNNKNSNQVAKGKEQEGWNSKKLTEEASQKDGDEIQREMSQDNSADGKSNDSETVGSIDKNETPQGREEAKNDKEGKANVNG